jgi:Tol biopolymer transport system component
MGESIGEPRADLEYLNPSLSPDGKLVAVNRMDPDLGTWDVWLIDTATKHATRLTTDMGSESDPVWSPDGKEIAYRSNRYGATTFYRVPVTGGASTVLTTLDNAPQAVPTDWSHDYILYQRINSMWALPLTGDPTPKQLDKDHLSIYPRLSPDGKWLAYGRYEDGRFEIFVKKFLADGPTKQVSHNGGVHPRWTRDGKEIVYWNPPGGIFAADVNIIGSDVIVGPERTIVDRPVLNLIDARPHYDITRDGERLLVRQQSGPPGPAVRVIVNWMSKIAK